MNSFLKRLIVNSLRTGAVASVTTPAAVATFGRLEDGAAVAPINAVSHIAWGDQAARQERASLTYTATGLALNTAAVTSWAALQELTFGRRFRRPECAAALLEGVAISALAYVVDYHVVPARLTPGFEKRLSNRSLLGVYAVLALSLAAGARMRA